MGSRVLLAALAGAFALAIVMAGCGSSGDGSSGGGDGGGGDSGSPVSESSISKAQYVKKAEAVCEKSNKEIEADFGAFVREKANVKKPTEKDYEELLDKVIVSNVETEIDALRELPVPEGEASEVEAMLAAREKSISNAEAEPEAVIQNTEKVFGEASKAAREYGLKACATR